MAHTPGPWKVWSDGNIIAPKLDNQLIAWVTWRNKNADETWDNARLVAAAPELLEACKAMLRDIIASDNDGYPVSDDDVIDAARAAIAKAEGKA